MSVGGVVIHYRAPDEAHGVVRALLQGGLEAENLWVANNGSEPGYADRLHRAYPGVNVLELPENPGYAAAANKGAEKLRQAGCAVILVCTHEIRFIGGSASTLAQNLVDSPDAARGPVVVHGETGEIWSAGGEISRIRRRAHNRANGWSMEQLRAADLGPPAWIEGCCMAIKMDRLIEIGGFFEDYFLYFEEVDLCSRLRAAGNSIGIDTQVVVSQTPGNFPRDLAIRNQTLYLRRCEGRLPLTVWIAENAARVTLRLFSDSGRSMARARIAAVREGARLGRQAGKHSCAGSNEPA